MMLVRFNILTIDEFGITNIELMNMLKSFQVYIHNVKDVEEAETAFKDPKVKYTTVVWAMNSVVLSVFDEIHRLKAKEEFKNIPIVIISKFTDKKYIIKAIEAGAVEYIAKPYNEETVLNKLCRVLGIPFEKTAENLLDEDILTYNFNEMLNKELKAVSRGGYRFSLMRVTVLQEIEPVLQEIEPVLSPEDSSQVIELINRVLKNNLRETDSSFIYKSNNIMILLPFADKDGAIIIEQKIKSIYDKNSMIGKKNKGYVLAVASITYPDDGKIKHMLLKKLEERFEKIINENR